MAVVVDALLDSQSVTGAYRFTVRPGETTQVDVELTLFPGPTSPMSGWRRSPACFCLMRSTGRGSTITGRRSMIWTGSPCSPGAATWRPLSNPQTLQISAFVDHGPRGFGLMQRKREFSDYRDLEARYERRPAVWVSRSAIGGPAMSSLSRSCREARSTTIS